jgi:pyroglutamyl-peptidase
LSSAARTILVTGFEPFGGETVNASWEAAKQLDGWRHGSFVAVARLLPCAYDSSVKKLIHEIEATRPEALLMTGQAARRAAVCVERFARNLDDAAAPDNDGVLRTAMKISGGAPARLEATASASAIARSIKEAGIPARISTDAGGFVCNHLFFGALQYLSSRGTAIPAVFLHLPVTPGQTPPSASAKRMTAGRAADALRVAAAAMIGASKSVETA